MSSSALLKQLVQSRVSMRESLVLKHERHTVDNIVGSGVHLQLVAAGSYPKQCLGSELG